MHQRVRSTNNDTCFNINEAWGSKLGAGKTRQQGQLCQASWHKQRPSSQSLYSADHLKNCKELHVITALNAQRRRATAARKEVRGIRAVQITGISHKSFIEFCADYSRGVHGSLVALLLICSIILYIQWQCWLSWKSVICCNPCCILVCKHTVPAHRVIVFSTQTS